MFEYFKNIWLSITTLAQGMQLTFLHLKNSKHLHKPWYVTHKNYFDQKTGIVTLDYPYESLVVPDNGRYKLHNEIDDCIVCDKCAVVCPVQCISIETIKSPVPIGVTSDGTVKRLYAEKFDIDMAKCCFCGLCTSVCPTECLTMSGDYDYSVVDIKKLNFKFGNLSPEQATEKKRLFEEFMLEKEKAKSTTPTSTPKETVKPAFTPKIPISAVASSPAPPNASAIKPVISKPVIKQPVTEPTTERNAQFNGESTKNISSESADTEDKKTENPSSTPKNLAPKPLIKPVIKKSEPPKTDTNA